MEARKKCRRKQDDGTMCPWGEDRSPDVSSPEQEPDPTRALIPRRVARRGDTDTSARQVNYMEAEELAAVNPLPIPPLRTPPPSLVPTTQETTWHRTEAAIARNRNKRPASHTAK
jgi:hypothetical protein